MKQNDKLYQTLQKMRPRLGMYLAEVELKHLSSFINGYFTAMHNFSLQDGVWWHDFHDFGAKKFGYSNSTAGVFNMCLANILGYTADDVDWEKVLQYPFSAQKHSQAIELFYNLLDEYFLFCKK